MPQDAPFASAGATRAEERLIRRVSHASVAVAGVLIIGKAAAWVATDSVSMLSTLVDSLLDACASLMNLFAVRISLTPPDQAHRFGHGKAEALSALGQAAFILGSAAFLIVEAVGRLVAPEPVRQSDLGIAVMLVSMMLTAALVAYQRRALRRVRSVTVAADNLHYLGDLLTNLAVIAALLLATTSGLGWVDPVLGLGIAGIILFGVWRIGRGALDELMDREVPDAERQRLLRLALSPPEVLAVHDFRTRRSGRRTFVQVRIEMDPELSLRRAHAVADHVEREIRAAVPHAEVIVHQDPFEPDRPARGRVLAPRRRGDTDGR